MQTNVTKNESVPRLRGIIGASQAQFARLIGVTVDAVKNWEGGRNGLSPQIGMRIEIATGANSKDLIGGDGRLRVSCIAKQAWLLKGRPKRHDWNFTKPDYKDWTKRTGRPSEESIPYLFRTLSQEIVTILYGAARAERAGTTGKCLTVFAAIVDAIQELRNGFRLETQIQKLMQQPEWKTSGLGLPPAIRRVLGRALQPVAPTALGKPLCNPPVLPTHRTPLSMQKPSRGGGS